MNIIASIVKTRKIISEARKRGKKIGFVPTMGALHAGHLSLIKKANKECNFFVVSKYVNPTQFAPGEDYLRYPRRLSKDSSLLRKEKVDLLFVPKADAMYSIDFSTFVEEIALSKDLCGKSRPAHFRGVSTVVAKLFNIVQPDIAYFGQKDYQQAQVIKRMVRDLNFSLNVKVLPTVREKDGLAISSRNAYLNYREREVTCRLYTTLQQAKEMISKGKRNPKVLIKKMKEMLSFPGLTRVDYVKIVGAQSLQDIKTIQGRVLIALAVYVGETRLIDNIVIDVKN